MTQFKNDLAFILRIVHCGYKVSFGNSFRGGIFCELVGRNIVIKQSRRRGVTTLWSSHQSQAIITGTMLLLNCAKGKKVQNCTICRLDRRSRHQGGVGEGQRGVQD